MSAPQRPKFEAFPCNASHVSLGAGWIPLISSAADFPLEIFEIAISQLIHHPEYNSTLILRSEIISDRTSDLPDSLPNFENLQKIRCIHRRLLPRRPGRDPPLEQYCTLYGKENSHPDTLLLTPIVEQGSPLPYYHPAVTHLAFRYFSPDPPTLQIDVAPLHGTPTDPNARLYRTCLALLETLHRYGWGAMTNYKKRVLHDCLVPREQYQDLYLMMRERHKHLVDTWQEVTDPLKHVFEDIGIATFLILLWKQTFAASNTEEEDPYEPWKSWPRPPSGFLDLGCGNGLLTHILVSEGYTGLGIDLRARASWAQYPELTKASLKVHAFDPTLEDNSYFKTGAFIIGNHADELTPWVPVLASLYMASGYLSIPCCSWTLDSRFERSSTPGFPLPDLGDEFVNSLNLGGDGSNKSSYSMYRIWLAELSLYCGWQVECETLRIPSTRNWAIIGRRRLEGGNYAENVKTIIEGVKNRGLFKTRKPEGKAGDH